MAKTRELGNIIKQLHEGVDVDTVKAEFEEKFSSVTSAEIIQMEQQLVDEGMAVEEIQKLCDIHADVFNMSIEDIHKPLPDHEREGHPIQVLKNENRALEAHMAVMVELAKAYEASESEEDRYALYTKSQELFDIDKHYARKEKSIFPLMEKYGYEAPPQVMWGVGDEIRDDLKAFHKMIEERNSKNITQVFIDLKKRIDDMILKEEKIMLPMISELITDEEWLEVAHDSEEIGYCLVYPKAKWTPSSQNFYDKVKEDLKVRDEAIHFDTGVLKLEQLKGILDGLPLDITFIDKDDKFRYFNQADGRVFIRSKSALGRLVHNCHPPRSVDMVNQILDDFKSGKKDFEEFWIEMKGMLVYISYRAIKNEFGEYIGTLETSFDVAPYRDLEGQKRLL